uniref:Uncharacterized protein n=1 Tax=Arundo donax TaxID=35708 RepID=A0A0A9FQ18_ARUDO
MAGESRSPTRERAATHRCLRQRGSRQR